MENYTRPCVSQTPESLTTEFSQKEAQKAQNEFLLILSFLCFFVATSFWSNGIAQGRRSRS
jgi:hypothetical protein